MKKTITFNGNKMTLKGIPLELNEVIPDFRAVNRDMEEVSLADYEGDVKVFTSFISLDTPVCDKQIKWFNEQALKLENVRVIGVSMDLPFAISRFYDMNNIKNMDLISDYKYRSFGLNYGLLIKEMNLLTRAVIIADASDILRYIEIVNEANNAPDYDRALNELKAVINNPEAISAEEAVRECLSCCEGASPLTPPQIQEYLSDLDGWELIDDRKIVKDYHRRSYQETKDLLDNVSVIADEQGHHPTMVLGYDQLKVVLTTHAVGELTENDFVMASLIDEVAGDSSGS